jgi:hypothetical protein
MAGIAAGVLILAVAVGVLAAYFVSPSYEDRMANDRPVSPVHAPDDEGAPSAPGAAASDGTTLDLIRSRSIEASFVQRATPQNILLNSTYIDDPSTNGDPNAFILAKKAPEPRGDAENSAHQIGVWYDARRGGRWAIFNEHRAPMAVGATFEVMVLKGSDRVVHRATLQNTVGNTTYIDDPLTNGNPDAVLTVTQNWNPGGEGSTYNDHPVGTRYDADEKQWVIFNRDLVPMPYGAAFNVAVMEDAP